MHGIAIWLGLANGSGHAYLWWSGIGSDIAEVLILGGIWQMYRKHNCHVARCWRIGHRKVEGTDYTVCRRHHPKGAPTHQDVIDAHNAT